jgi:hypothetical protein
MLSAGDTAGRATATRGKVSQQAIAGRDHRGSTLVRPNRWPAIDMLPRTTSYAFVMSTTKLFASNFNQLRQIVLHSHQRQDNLSSFQKKIAN